MPLAIVGPTASGKSALALRVAQRLPGTEIISVDSMQVYRGMDIGTAKPSAEERSLVRHHMVDLVDPWDDFSVAEFQRDARAAVNDIRSRGGRAIFVGGTGLYFRAVIDNLEIPGRYPEARAEAEHENDSQKLHAWLQELDPVAARRIEPGNRRRTVRALEVTLGSGRPFSSYGPGLTEYPAARCHMIGLQMEKELLGRRIEARYEQQLDRGFLDEVRSLAEHPRDISRTARQALGYRELLSHVEQRVPLAVAVDEAVRRTKSFARRQRMWFRRDPRITWLNANADAEDLVADLLENWTHDHIREVEPHQIPRPAQ